jgi:hypothetical protein
MLDPSRFIPHPAELRNEVDKWTSSRQTIHKVLPYYDLQAIIISPNTIATCTLLGTPEMLIPMSDQSSA